MAFPTIPAGGFRGFSSTSNSTTYTPTGSFSGGPGSVGDLIVAFVSADGAPTLTTSSSGWTKLGQASNGTVVTGAVFYCYATAADNTFPALTVNSTASEQYAISVLRFKGSSANSLQIEVAFSNGSSTNSDPPLLTPTAGTQDYYWVVSRHGDSNVNATAGPSGYSGWGGVNNGSTNGCTIDTAYRTATASSENPGVFTSASEQWVCATAAIWNGATALTPSLFTNTNTFYAATVDRGAVTLSPAMFSDSNTFYAPTVANVVPGQTLSPALFSDSETFYPATLNSSITLTATLFSDSEAFYAATIVPGAVTLSPALFTGGNTFYAATISNAAPTQTLVAGFYSDSDTFYAATVNRGAVALAPALFSDSDTFYTATVNRGAVTLRPTLLSDGDTFYAASLSSGALAQTLSPSLVSDADTFYAATVNRGAVTLSPALYSDGDTFYAAVAENTAWSQYLSQSTRFDNSSTFYGAQLGSQITVSPGRYDNTSGVYNHVASVQIAVVPARFDNSSTFYAAVVTQGPGVQALSPELYQSTNSFYSGLITTGLVGLTASLFSNGSRFPAPSLWIYPWNPNSDRRSMSPGRATRDTMAVSTTLRTPMTPQPEPAARAYPASPQAPAKPFPVPPQR